MPKLSVSEKFFTVPSGTSAQVLRVMDEIKKRNNRSEFVTKFAATNGYPVWNKVLMGTSQKQYANASLSGNSLDGVTDTTILIPFVMEGEFSVKGFIKATLNDSVSLSYSLAKDYKAYEEKLDNSKTASSAFAMLSMVLNKIVFNEDTYKITNPKLFSTDTLHDKTSKIKITAFNFSITDSAGFKQTTICVEHSTILTHCGTPDNAACIPVCDAPFCPGGQCWQVEISLKSKRIVIQLTCMIYGQVVVMAAVATTAAVEKFLMFTPAKAHKTTHRPLPQPIMLLTLAIAPCRVKVMGGYRWRMELSLIIFWEH